jgi:hypothetical protein
MESPSLCSRMTIELAALCNECAQAADEIECLLSRHHEFQVDQLAE